MNASTAGKKPGPIIYQIYDPIRDPYLVASSISVISSSDRSMKTAGNGWID